MVTTPSPSHKAMLAGAKALRLQAHPYAFDCNLYEKGIRSPHLKMAFTTYHRLHKYARELEQAGRKPVNGKVREATDEPA